VSLSSLPSKLLAGRLSPVGEPIALQAKTQPDADVFPENYDLLLLNSGTAALSLAMTIAALSAETSSPEVILPAYGCPDLLAAAYYAGLRPVLADIQEASPRYQQAALDAAISGDTVAIVAVNFLGIGEDLPYLRALCDRRGLVLIEDDAQYLPLDRERSGYCGDLVVHSFGRGKPVSLVGGGALLARRPALADSSSTVDRLPLHRVTERQWRLKARLFNLILRPHVYQLLALLPFLRIGATRYHALEGIERMDTWREAYMRCNVACYRQRSRLLQAQLDAGLEALNTSTYINLPRSLQGLDRPLLRYPLLCSSEEQCEVLFAGLEDHGLGASRMYRRALPQIENIPHPIVGRFPGAEAFAGRLLTLPLTSLVNQGRLDKILELLRRYDSQG
jgi:dTDP-4-amino-4,6-dideoxygalactose transaminase